MLPGPASAHTPPSPKPPLRTTLQRHHQIILYLPIPLRLRRHRHLHLLHFLSRPCSSIHCANTAAGALRHPTGPNTTANHGVRAVGIGAEPGARSFLGQELL